MKSYVRCLAAMGIAGGMALSAAAARTVSENLTLTRDTDWSADVVTVANGVTIDLNGHVLKVAGLDGATAASGTVTSSNGGELRFVIPAGTTNTLSKTRLAGNLRVFKEGPGGLVLGLSGQTYSGGARARHLVHGRRRRGRGTGRALHGGHPLRGAGRKALPCESRRRRLPHDHPVKKERSAE